MATNSQTLTADDVLALPTPNGVEGYELVDGKPVPVTPASLTHGGLVAEVALALGSHVRQAGLPGRVFVDAGFVLSLPHDPERMRAPDVSYVGRDKLDANPDPERLYRGVPDLAVGMEGAGLRSSARRYASTIEVST